MRLVRRRQRCLGRHRGNTMTPTGHVRTWAEHDAVVAAAWRATGVMEVVDLLQIRG